MSQIKGNWNIEKPPKGYEILTLLLLLLLFAVLLCFVSPILYAFSNQLMLVLDEAYIL